MAADDPERDDPHRPRSTVPEPIASPAARRLATPSWLDARLVLGVLLVLVSVVIGARVLSSADASEGVWVVTRDLSAGSALSEGDLARRQVRLYDSGPRYLLAAGAKPVGYVLQRPVGAHELLPRDSLVRPDATVSGRREVAVPVATGHLPDDLRAGQQVDVYVTPGSATIPAATGTRLVLAHVTVTARSRTAGLGAASGAGVVLAVGVSDAATLVTALQQGPVDLVRVPRADEAATLVPATGTAQAAGQPR